MSSSRPRNTRRRCPDAPRRRRTAGTRSRSSGIGFGKFVRSGTFTVGGHDWAIRFYPDGLAEDSKEYVTVYLELVSSNAAARARYELLLVTHGPAPSGVKWSSKEARLFNSCDPATRFGPRNSRFVLRSVLEQESSAYIRGDRLKIECNVTVIGESQLSETRVESEFEVPPSDIAEHLGKLLKEKEAADVTLSVGGETFAAHKIVLAMRSPVFKAELFGPMKETRMCRITIKDMQPAVFKVLLHFIYNDSLPHMDGDLDGEDYGELIRHLLVAADRYAMDRLKMICESLIHKTLNVENVAITMALADQHNCDRLKDACVEFIASSNELEAVVSTQGYASLKRSCPSVLVDLLEKTSKRRKT
ncbi:hypothetical protein ACP70R_003103 [Stipagrostis hirtigluma subsp. patula]